MSDHRDALARTIENALWARSFWSGPSKSYAVIDALRAEGWSIVKLRHCGGLVTEGRKLYVITEGEA